MSKCGDCQFYHERTPKHDYGECHFDPPSIARVMDDHDVLNYWPGVQAEEWCGKFKGQEQSERSLKDKLASEQATGCLLRIAEARVRELEFLFHEKQARVNEQDHHIGELLTQAEERKTRVSELEEQVKIKHGTYWKQQAERYLKRIGELEEENNKLLIRNRELEEPLPSHEQLRVRIRKLEEENKDLCASHELHVKINEASARALDKPIEGEGSSWHDIPDRIVDLKRYERMNAEALDKAVEEIEQRKEQAQEYFDIAEGRRCVIGDLKKENAQLLQQNVSMQEQLNAMVAQHKADFDEIGRAAERKLIGALGVALHVKNLMGKIEMLRDWVDDLHSGMYINCVYCGHRYGPRDSTPMSMADVLKEHVEQCPEHPMSKLKKAAQDYIDAHRLGERQVVSYRILVAAVEGK